MKCESKLLRLVCHAAPHPAAGLGAIACALAAFACGGEGPSGERERPSAPGRPSQVPAEYVATANGYMHPSCIVEVAPGEEIFLRSEDGMELRGVDGRTRPLGRCAYPRFRSDGEIIPVPASTRSSDEPNLPGESVGTTSSALHATFGQAFAPAKALLSIWQVPPSPPSPDIQVTVWPGLQPASGPGWVLQPILENFAGDPWYIKACFFEASSNMFPCFPEGTGRLFVNPNDYILGYVVGSNCNANTGVCGTWTVQVLNWSTGQATDPLVVHNFTQKADRIIAADLELFGVTSCDQLPAEPQLNFNTQWLGFDDVWRTSIWDVQQRPAGLPACKFDSWVVRHPSGQSSLYLGWWRGYPPYALSFDTADFRLYTGLGDWAPGQYKSECSTADWVVGLSSTPFTNRAHSALCAYDGNVNSKLLNPSFSVPVDFSTSSVSRDTTALVGDWDPNYFKGECAFNEAVTGVAQDTSGKLTKILCTRMYEEASFLGCYPRIFSPGDNRGNTAGEPDWAPGYHKGQCDGPAESTMIRGISRHPQTGEAHAILCCPTFTVRGI
jgi:hypothetical protein